MTKKKINVVPYDPKWHKIFEAHADELRVTLGKNVVQIYHVGSTSVPGLCAKPEVDIMCVVRDLKSVAGLLESIGYIAKGEFNLPMRLFFSRKTPDDINLHVLKENSGEIKWNLCFQNYLRKNKEAKDMYAATKLKLLDENPDGFNVLPSLITDYTTKKGEVIRKIAKMAGFSGFRFVTAFNDNEIQTFKSLLNLDKIDFENLNVFNLCLYKGVEITAVALVEFYNNFSKAKIRKINALNDENEKVMMEKIEEWLEFKGTILEGS